MDVTPARYENGWEEWTQVEPLLTRAPGLQLCGRLPSSPRCILRSSPVTYRRHRHGCVNRTARLERERFSYVSTLCTAVRGLGGDSVATTGITRRECLTTTAALALLRVRGLGAAQSPAKWTSVQALLDRYVAQRDTRP